MKCPACGADNDDMVLSCNLCGKVLRESFHSPTELEARRVIAAERAERERVSKEYYRTRAKNHGITGIITFFILITAIGLPGSLNPLQLIWNLALSALFGFPLGYIISKLHGGVIKGALVSAGFFTLLFIISSWSYIFSPPARGETPSSRLLVQVLIGIAAGVVPGGIIGLHVKSDE